MHTGQHCAWQRRPIAVAAYANVEGRADRQVLAAASDAETAQLRAFVKHIQRNCAGVVDSRKDIR